MTEEKLIEMVKNKHSCNGWVVFIACTFIGIVAFLLSGVPFALALPVVGAIFGIKTHFDEIDYINDPKKDLLFHIFDSTDTLIKVMDEIICHPIFNNKIKISEHFILYEDKYEKIIRLCDVTGIANIKVDNFSTKIGIEDCFGQRKVYKFKKEEAEKIYNYLKENCKNAKEIDNIEPNEYVIIHRGFLMTEEYAFEGDNKATNKDSKEDKKEENIKAENKPSNKKQKKSNQPKIKKKSDGSDDNYDKLIKLKKLLDEDIITKEEFDKEKAKILSD